MESLYPERLQLWQSIATTEELNCFIDSAITKYLALYDSNSKGKNRYANLFLEWIQCIRTYTCTTEQTAHTKAEWDAVISRHGSVAEETQRTLIASVLHGVQEAIQNQMATSIEKIVTNTSEHEAESLSDDTALYRISGWALKSAIQLSEKAIRMRRGKAAEHIAGFTTISCLKTDKGFKVYLANRRSILGSWRPHICTPDHFYRGLKQLKKT